MLALAGNNYQTPTAPPTPIPNQAPLNRGMKPPTAVNAPLPVAQGPRMSAPTGRPADASPSQLPLAMSPANPQVAPPTSPATAASPLPLAAGPSTSPYASITPNTPGGQTDYTNKTIAPGPGTDRLALAKSNFENFAKSSEPEYQAALRDASQQAAGAGQIGSGMARGRFGDIGLAHARDLDTARTSFLNDATSGGIEDNYRNIGIAQQQQGYQSGQQQTAFNQAAEQQQLEEMLRQGQFGRSATTLGLGEQGNPSDIALALSGIYGKQSGDAGGAAGSLLGNSQLQELLKRYGSGIVPGTPDAGGVPQVTKGGSPIDIGSLIH